MVRLAHLQILPFVSVIFGCLGCSLLEYRQEADREAYAMIQERNFDPRWHQQKISVEVDPRSRYFDPFDPDHPPLPPDDPASHAYMHCVDGMEGWKHWHDDGERSELENPSWQQALGEYVPLTEKGEVKLGLDEAVRLAYVHSPNYQRQLETLYLSSLDVTEERFRLDTQYFGGYDLDYRHNGGQMPAIIGFDSANQQYVISGPFDVPESNRLTLGKPNGGDPVLQARRRFATAGELLIGFANSFVFEFTGNNVSLGSSLANFSFIQPLLRGAGKDVALESLTFQERVLLANLRAYAQFRQGFFTQIAIGELGVTGPNRGFSTTDLTSFSGNGFVSGHLGLLQQLQQIRNSNDNLKLQLRTLTRLVAYLDVGVIDLVQVDQFRQSVENERSNLLRIENSYQLDLDRYKVNTLGLPPDLPVDLDDTLLTQFQLITPEASSVMDKIVGLQDAVGTIPDDADRESVFEAIQNLESVVDTLANQFDTVRADIGQMNDFAPERTRGLSGKDLNDFEEDRKNLNQSLVDLEQEFFTSAQNVISYRTQLTDENQIETLENLVVWLNDVLRIMQRLSLIQARARLEVITVPEINLSPEDAYQIALSNRLDFMNGRAALVDDWRLIKVRADALQATLNVTGGGDIRTSRNNATNFRAPTGSLQLGVEFDAPFTRLLERNDYREALIRYQQSRRQFIQSSDQLHLGLRALLRQTEQLRRNLEIQRRAVTIAIRRVDLTQAALAAPVPPPRPGQRAAQFNPTTAINLLSAQSSLRDTQNQFLSAWLNYYAARMRLVRELGIMSIDTAGNWVETEIPTSMSNDEDRLNTEGLNAPPLPEEWMVMAELLSVGQGFSSFNDWVVNRKPEHTWTGSMTDRSHRIPPGKNEAIESSGQTILPASGTSQ